MNSADRYSPMAAIKRWLPTLSREKTDTLLLLFACALVLAQQFSSVPAWVAASCSLLLAWRCWLTFGGYRMPPRWLLLPVSALAMVGIYVTYRTLLGREPGVAMLVLLLTLKLLEMHARRDLFVVIFLSFFLMLTSLFNSQSIGAALMLLFALTMMLTAQLSFQYVNTAPPLLQRFKLALTIIALAAPLMVVAFILFPRVQGPLWGMPSDAHSGRTGLSETMSPGNFSQLALSDDVAFRVKFHDAAPDHHQLYWRAIVLDHYDGRIWTRGTPPKSIRADNLSTRGKLIRYQVTLEPHRKNWLFILEMPAATPVLADLLTTLDSDLQATASQPIMERIRYSMVSRLEGSFDQSAKPAELRRWLQLPNGYNNGALLLAARLRQQSTDEVQLVNSVLAYFRNEPFRYTLEPPLLGRDAIDDFLFNSRAGFCEHYSSAFVVLMRAMGIPARVVTGYQGGEMNPLDGFMTVRQSDAHAWAEVWLSNRGWMRIDPTSAVAPSRIERGLRNGANQSMLGGLLTIGSGQDSWLNAVRFRWAAISNAWNQSVLNYTTDKQRKFIQSFGFETVDWRTMAILLIAAAGVVLSIIAFPLLRHRQRLDPVKAIYGHFCQLMERKGLPRAMHEGPLHYRMRIMHADAALNPEKKLAAERFLTFYETVQYGTVSDFSRSATIGRLKSLLAQCR